MNLETATARTVRPDPSEPFNTHKETPQHLSFWVASATEPSYPQWPPHWPPEAKARVTLQREMGSRVGT